MEHGQNRHILSIHKEEAKACYYANRYYWQEEQRLFLNVLDISLSVILPNFNS